MSKKSEMLVYRYLKENSIKISRLIRNIILMFCYDVNMKIMDTIDLNLIKNSLKCQNCMKCGIKVHDVYWEINVDLDVLYLCIFCIETDYILKRYNKNISKYINSQHEYILYKSLPCYIIKNPSQSNMVNKWFYYTLYVKTLFTKEYFMNAMNLYNENKCKYIDMKYEDYSGPTISPIIRYICILSVLMYIEIYINVSILFCVYIVCQ